MVQEVQTWVWITNETTLETIEAVGTSSFKIVEWRQTKWGRYVSRCKWSGSVSWTYQSPASKVWPEVSWTFTLTDSYGKAPFIIRNGGIRIPQQWTYEITVYWGSSWISNSQLILKAWGREIYRKLLYAAQSETATFEVDLWKFDIIELWGQFEYTSSWTTVTLYYSPYLQITVKQL